MFFIFVYHFPSPPPSPLALCFFFKKINPSQDTAAKSTPTGNENQRGLDPVGQIRRPSNDASTNLHGLLPDKQIQLDSSGKSTTRFRSGSVFNLNHVITINYLRLAFFTADSQTPLIDRFQTTLNYKK